MRIHELRVVGLRSLRDATLEMSDLTAIVGRNGAGKSTVLHALRLFYDPNLSLLEEDFFNRKTDQQVRVVLTFKDLPASAQTLYASYLHSGRLKVERVFTWEAGKCRSRYHGHVPINPEFKALRAATEIKDRAKTAKEEYQKLIDSGYRELPAWSTLEGVREVLQVWESAHRDRCAPSQDEGSYFSFGNGGDGDLTRLTRLLFVPAVREAATMASESRASVFSELLDLVVRSVLSLKEPVIRLQADLETRYVETFAPGANPELGDLATRLSKSLCVFAPGSSVVLDWHPTAKLTLPMPTADVSLLEDGYKAPVDHCGHGLQRAFIVSVLQQLNAARTEAKRQAGQGGEPELLDHLLLIIEEPELFQHPTRQRLFARVLDEISGQPTPGVATQTQVAYATHSPLFVRVEQIDDIRLFRKVFAGGAAPGETHVVSADLEEVALRLWEADGSKGPKYSATTLRPRLTSLMTPWVNEGFFADVAVLVEGEDDWAAILGQAVAMGHDFEAMGIAVIPCRGKTSLDRPAAIFRQLGIRTFVLWDSDKGEKDARPEDNHRLLRLHGAAVEDWPAKMEEHYACFESNLDSVLRSELGVQEHQDVLDELMKEWGIHKQSQAVKKPEVVAELIRRCGLRGRSSKTLTDVVERIVAAGKAEKAP